MPDSHFWHDVRNELAMRLLAAHVFRTVATQSGCQGQRNHGCVGFAGVSGLSAFADGSQDVRP